MTQRNPLYPFPLNLYIFYYNSNYLIRLNNTV